MTARVCVLHTAVHSRGNILTQLHTWIQRLFQCSHPCPCCHIILSIMDDKQGAAEALTEPSTSIKPTSLRSGEEKSDLHYQTRGRGWHRYGKIWQLLLSLRDTTKPHNPSSHQERGYSSSISSGQETGLIAKLKITESLSIHPSLDVGRLNKYGHTGLQVKWKDVK